MIGKHRPGELFVTIALMPLQRNGVLAVQQILLRGIEVFNVGVSRELVEELCPSLDHLESLGVDHC